MTTFRPAEPTGRQVALRSSDGRITAQIAQVGASLRALTVDGVALVPPYPAGSTTPGASGIVLVPWPNRIRDGKWTQRGETRQLPVTELSTNTATHGLLRFRDYLVTESADGTEATLASTVFPQTGYPFHLDTTVTYRLTDRGIDVEHVLTNVGADDAPVALGTHPYLCFDAVDTADLVLRVPGDTYDILDERLLPVEEVPVDAATDLRSGARLGDIDVNRAYGRLSRDAEGTARTTLTAPDGRSVTLWQGAGFDYVQVYTTDRYPGRPLAVAVEPMTAPADAFNSGTGLTWLQPGESWSLRWGITT
ncbi:aldose 1-epimerase family protein [Microbacterium sp. P02]|uniref:aldose 1-epimerase family protein n=1 Tax=Microbacterium sp. P02 TaxID=3366260 RepID=UPI0036726936